MTREVKRMCWRCAEALQKAGISCVRMSNAGGSSGTCGGCGKHRVCESWEITYGRRPDGKESNYAD